jgi:hypothetical protein
MKNAISIFMVILIIQLFYATSITIFAYSLPFDVQSYAEPSTTIASDVNIESISQDLEENLQSQLNIPLIDLGALVFYSGNLLLDLLLNFLTALPQLLSLILTTIFGIMNIDSQIPVFVQLFLTGIVTIFYFISLIQLITNIRGRGTII